MSYEYTDESRASDTYAQPDVEVYDGRPCYSSCCDTAASWHYATACAGQPCPTCEQEASWKTDVEPVRYWYAFGIPGCLPDGSEMGPFDTYALALADAREVAGVTA